MGTLRACIALLVFVIIATAILASSPHEARPLAPFRLIYIKTHKTASSTLASILRRIGKARGMRFVNPPDQTNVESLRSLVDAPFDIICNHVRDSPWLDFLVPNATRITIVRDPLSRFLSAWRFFQYERYLGPLSAFLDRCANHSCRHVQVRGKPVFNELAWMLGVESTASLTELSARITDASSRSPFRLVLLADRFDESLVLLARLLSLSLGDVAYLPVKAHEANQTAAHLRSLSARQRGLILALNDWDAMIYRAAAQQLQGAIAQAGTIFAAQVAEFKSAQSELLRYCGSHYEALRCVELRKDSRQLTAESAQEARDHRATAPAWLSEFIY